MIRFLSLLAVLLLFYPVSVFAQEDTDAVLEETADVPETSTTEVQSDAGEADKPIKPVIQDEDYEERLELSRKMHEIWPVRPKIESALEQITEQIPQQERLKFKAGMRKAIQFDAVEVASVNAMADIFTAEELKAMIAFYGSKEGRSVSHKTSDYERALEPIMIKMMDKALMDVKVGSQ